MADDLLFLSLTGEKVAFQLVKIAGEKIRS